MCYEGVALAQTMAGATELADSVGELMDSPGGRLLLDIKAHLRRRVRLLAVVFGLTFVVCFPLTSMFIAWLIEPDLFTGKFCNVEIEVNSRLTRGATVIDWWGVTGRKENATVINDVDANGFFELLFERLENLG